MTSKTQSQHQKIITNYMYLGLLPFFGGAIGPWFLPHYEIQLTQFFSFYSSVILAFLAGALWSIALRANALENAQRHLHVAIAFSLWPLVCYLLPELYGQLLMLCGFLALLLWEKRYVNVLYTPWYANLRHKITFIVLACHMLVIWNHIKM